MDNKVHLCGKMEPTVQLFGFVRISVLRPINRRIRSTAPSAEENRSRYSSLNHHLGYVNTYVWDLVVPVKNNYGDVETLAVEMDHKASRCKRRSVEWPMEDQLSLEPRAGDPSKEKESTTLKASEAGKQVQEAIKIRKHNLKYHFSNFEVFYDLANSLR